eukprot:3783688-Prymnesium_polylepis.1
MAPAAAAAAAAVAAVEAARPRPAKSRSYPRKRHPSSRCLGRAGRQRRRGGPQAAERGRGRH